MSSSRMIRVGSSITTLVCLALAGCGGGGSSAPTAPGAQNPAPSITTLSPSSSTAGAQPQTLTIKGANFLSSSTVTYNGESHAATLVSSAQLTISLTASDQAIAGSYPVIVTNPPPGGAPSNSVNFTVNNPQPVLNSVSPSVIVGGCPNTLISVVGANFVTQSAVNLNGAALATSFVSSARLTATVPASSLASGGIIRVTVTTPTPGGGTSASQNLTVTEPLPAGASGPLIESLPPTAALVGKAMQYQVLASSADPSSLVFSLSAAPATMTINATTGLLQWTPGPDQVGDHSVTIVAQDSAGQTSQSFTLSVFGSRPVASATISAANGGVITVNDPTSNINGLSISIPAGALASDTTIVVSELPAPPTLGGTPHFFMKGFSVQPDGTSLAVPATITVPYSVSEFGSGAGVPLESFLGVHFLQAETGDLEWLDGFSADRVKHVITGSVSHFSPYVPANGFELCAPPQPSSSFDPNDCASVTQVGPSVSSLPVVLVHGFWGHKTTWGQLPALLAHQGIHAWRFDWPSTDTSFETAAGKLGGPDGGALQAVEGFEKTTAVNLVSHSFGGILVRTYLEGKASSASYRRDVNRVMTLGTPHSGIGFTLSTYFANACAYDFILQPQTCSEAIGGGAFMSALNSTPLPPLNASLSPQYDLIAGQRVSCSLVSCSLQNDDGLITTAGNQLCGTLPGGGGFPNECSGLSVVEEINPGVPANATEGLCHSQVLVPIPCASGINQPMASVDSDAHPLWNKICTFLGGCAPVAGTHTLTVASTNPSNGVPITVAPTDVNGQSDGTTQFMRTYDNGALVSLGAPSTVGGNNFASWTGCDSVSGTTCTVTIGADRTVTANYVLAGTSTLTVASINPSIGVAITVSPSDNNGQGNGATAFMRIYNKGALVSLGAPSTVGGNNFAGWTGCDSTSGTACTVTMNGGKTVIANYIPTSPDKFAYQVNPACALNSQGIEGCVSIYGIDASLGFLIGAGGPVPADLESARMAVDPSGRFAYVVNTGSNDVSMYTIDTAGGLTPTPACAGCVNTVAAGSFPFFIAVHSSGKFAYVLNQDSHPILAYTVDGTTGALTETTSFAGGTANSIAIHPSGGFAYVADGGFNRINTFGIDQTTGDLTLIDTIPVDGYPFGFVLHPSGRFAYALHRSADEVLVFTIDSNTGKLTPTGAATTGTGSGPASVVIDPLGKFANVLYTNTAQNMTTYAIDNGTGALTDGRTFAPEPGLALDSLTLDRSGKFAYIATTFDFSCPIIDSPFTSLVSISAYTIDRGTGLLTPSGKVCADFSGTVVLTSGPGS